MGRVFTAYIDASFFDMLTHYIFSEYKKKEIQTLKVILPCEKDVTALLNAFKKCSTKKPFILPEIVSLESIGKEDLITALDRVKIIKPVKKVLLLIQLILEWNKKNNANLPIDIVYDLQLLLDKSKYIYNKTGDFCHSNTGESVIKNEVENFINLLIKTWSGTLEALGELDILEYEVNHINSMISSLRGDQNIIFIGIGNGEVYKLLIKAIYTMPFGKIILPHLNLKIREKNWNSLDEKHYQYCLKDLLDYLNVDRKNVTCLNNFNSKIDYAFDTTTDLSKIDNVYAKNVEIVTCNFMEEEVQVISLIMKNEGYKNISLLIFDELLANRIVCSSFSENYSYVTLLLYSVEVLVSNWSCVPLLALLKHKEVTFDYSKKEYAQIISEFETEVLRKFSTNKKSDIISAIHSSKKLKFKKDLLSIINKLEDIFDPLLNSVNCYIMDIVKTHLKCINLLSGINFPVLDNKISNFVYDFLDACKDIKIKCSLELYKKIITLFLKKEFLSVEIDFKKFSLYHNKIIILAGFNIPNFGNPLLSTSLAREKLRFPSIQEEHGRFLYVLRCLFDANKVYIIRLSSSKEPLLLQRLKILTHGLTKYPYLDWLKVLNTPKYFVKYVQPMPIPKADARRKTMKVMSCSAIEKLICDPYSFYVKYILNLKKTKDLNPKPSALEFGTIVHSILYKCYLNKKFQMSIVKKLFFSSGLNFSSMWWVRLKKIIKSFIRFNNTRNNSYLELEKKFYYPVVFNTKNSITAYEYDDITSKPKHQVLDTNTAEKILLVVTCDRVEYLSNGKISIIDYKMGSILPSNKEFMSGFFPQLILQALAVEYVTKKEVSELAYWQPESDKISYINSSNYREKLREFRENLPYFLSSYLKESTPFVALPYFSSKSLLRLHDYKQLKRIEEWF